MALARAHVSIRGRVQGVCFRMYTHERARELGLAGWVRNRYDGTVEAVFEGEDADVKAMVDWCRTGPAYASVAEVSVDWQEPKGHDRGFGVRHTR